MAKKYTLQELFSKAVKGLAKQGFARATNDSTCQYITPDGGKRCAIGHLLTKPLCAELQSSGGGSYDTVRSRLPKSITEVLDETDRNTSCPLPFGSLLQGCHDNASTPNGVKENLIEFATDHNLTLPKELQ